MQQKLSAAETRHPEDGEASSSANGLAGASPESQAVAQSAPPPKLAISPQVQDPRDLQERFSAESVDRSSHSQSSTASKDGSRLELRLRGWKGRLSKSHDGVRDLTEKSGARGEERQPKAKEKRESHGKESSTINFSERMSSMFAAASNTLRPSSARREGQSM